MKDILVTGAAQGLGRAITTRLVGDNSAPEVLERYRSRELVKAPLKPADVAGTVSFLLSESGRNYTGAVFDLNNGFHL